MHGFKIFAVLTMLAVLAGCGTKFKTYNGPEVTRVLVYKEHRMLYLMHNDEVLESYKFELGFAPTGHKAIEGDGRTPEGNYIIDRRNPNSSFHLSIGISYPNERDRAVARELGESPGGNIFIHGTPRRFRRTDDWTLGCIAVTNREIEQIYAMVKNGTVISIYE